MGRIPPNVLKLRKQKRQGRRAYLSRYNEMHVPRSVGKSGIPKDAVPLFSYRDRVVSPGRISFLNAIFPDVKYGDRRVLLDGYNNMVNTSNDREIKRAAGRSMLRVHLSDADTQRLVEAVEDDEVCDCYTVHQGGITKTRLTLVYNIQKTRLYFIEVAARDNGASYMMKSIVYGAEDRALFAYRHRNISWLECVPLASLELVLPRRV